jgi:hypothetical protein
MKAGIVTDDYKVLAFEKGLREAGFKCESTAFKKGQMIISVEFEATTKDKLVEVVRFLNEGVVVIK